MSIDTKDRFLVSAILTQLMRIRIPHSWTWRSWSWLTAEAVMTVMRMKATTVVNLGYL
jgi:hypothetical protein